MNSIVSSTNKRLEDKVALITGGASGIGKATAKVFVKYGAKVVIADIQDDLGHALCEEIGNDQVLSYVHCDVTSNTDVEKAMDMVVSKHGKLDIVYSNAGINLKHFSTLLATDPEDFRRVMDVNLFGGFLVAKHAARVMIPMKTGSIIFTSSICSLLGGKAPYAYTASKHALVGLMKNLCVELGQYGIRVNCIAPYYVATSMTMEVTKMGKKETEEYFYESAILKGVVLEAEDVAEAAVYLGSDESKYVSGLNLVVDGGFCTTNPGSRERSKSLFSSSSSSMDPTS